MARMKQMIEHMFVQAHLSTITNIFNVLAGQKHMECGIVLDFMADGKWCVHLREYVLLLACLLVCWPASGAYTLHNLNYSNKRTNHLHLWHERKKNCQAFDVS